MAPVTQRILIDISTLKRCLLRKIKAKIHHKIQYIFTENTLQNTKKKKKKNSGHNPKVPTVIYRSNTFGGLNG